MHLTKAASFPEKFSIFLSINSQSSFPNIEISSFEVLSRYESEDLNDEVCSIVTVRKKKSNSLFARDILDQRSGWPLLRRVNSAIPQNYVRQLSIVQWAMALLDRSSLQNPWISIFEESCEFKVVNFKAQFNGSQLKKKSIYDRIRFPSLLPKNWI